MSNHLLWYKISFHSFRPFLRDSGTNRASYCLKNVYIPFSWVWFWLSQCMRRLSQKFWIPNNVQWKQDIHFILLIYITSRLTQKSPRKKKLMHINNDTLFTLNLEYTIFYFILQKTPDKSECLRVYAFIFLLQFVSEKKKKNGHLFCVHTYDKRRKTLDYDILSRKARKKKRKKIRKNGKRNRVFSPPLEFLASFFLFPGPENLFSVVLSEMFLRNV